LIIYLFFNFSVPPLPVNLTSIENPLGIDAGDPSISEDNEQYKRKK